MTNMYLEHGLEFTKKFEDTLVKVNIIPHGSEGLYLAKTTAVRNNRLIIESKIMIDEEHVNLAQAEAIAALTATARHFATSKTR